MRLQGGLVLALAALLAVEAARAEDPWPYPAGRSSQDISGLRVELDLPPDLDADEPASLVVILHGAGGTATGMAGALRGWTADGYVVAAPKSSGQVWEGPDLEKARAVTRHLMEVLPVDADRIHVVGFSNGSFHLHHLAFDDDIRPVSATWVAGGHMGPSPPRWARDRLATICLVGEQDGNFRVARETAERFRGDARSTELRVQPNLGHEWPDALMPYLRWWMGCMEGRVDPAADLSFAWTADLDAALARIAGERRGGVMVWLWRREDAGSDFHRELQNAVFMDPLVRFFGEQLMAVRLEATEHAEAVAGILEAERVRRPTWPLLLVYDTEGRVKTTLQGDWTARKLAGALRRVAPERRAPEDR